MTRSGQRNAAEKEQAACVFTYPKHVQGDQQLEGKEINSLRAEMAEDDPFILAQICYINMSIDSYGSFLLT